MVCLGLAVMVKDYIFIFFNVLCMVMFRNNYPQHLYTMNQQIETYYGIHVILTSKLLLKPSNLSLFRLKICDKVFAGLLQNYYKTSKFHLLLILAIFGDEANP